MLDEPAVQLNEHEVGSHERERHRPQERNVGRHPPHVQPPCERDREDRRDAHVDTVIVAKEKHQDADKRENGEPPPVGTVDVPPQGGDGHRVGEELRIVIEARRHGDLHQRHQQRDQDRPRGATAHDKEDRRADAQER